MSTDHTRDAADADAAHGRLPRIGSLSQISHEVPSEEHLHYPMRLLTHPALRDYSNNSVHASVMRNMQQTYGNLQTRRTVQRAVTIDDFFSGVSPESEEEKKERQREMTAEEKVKEMTDETDDLDENWAGMSGQERQRMIEGQNQQARDTIEMQAAERADDPGAYEKCPDPASPNCGRDRDPEENPIPELDF